MRISDWSSDVCSSDLFAGLGPAPFCAMLLSDLGADVVMVDRKDRPAPAPDAGTHRGRRHLPLDLKNAAAIEACLMLAERADILIEGFQIGRASCRERVCQYV